MKTVIKAMAWIALGLFVGAGGMWLFGTRLSSEADTASEERKPLYWVAPMNPNYRRDKPGKSPMGMDLVPVYKEENAGTESPGTVRISPDVINNLGVRTAAVVRGHFETKMHTVGYVQYDEDRLVHISPRVDGWIEKLYVKAEGDPVTKGAPLYAIYSPTLVNAQEELVLALNRDNPRLIQAATGRLSALQAPSGLIRRVKKTRRANSTITIYAPQSGVLDDLAVREGMFVKPGTSMMSIGALDEIWAVGEVFERQAAQVHAGDRVIMELDYLPQRRWVGAIEYVYPTLDSKTRTLRIRARFANGDGQLKPGMFAQLIIEPRLGQETLLIPREALIRTGERSRVVLALGEGRFKSITVTVGRIGEHYAEILSGLDENERIVTSAQFLIDSESSKTSDFKRMHHGKTDRAMPNSVWVAARVKSLMAKHHMATLIHEPIEAWQWPAMTMDFTVAAAVDMSKLKVGQQVHVEITKTANGGYQISRLHVPDAQRTHKDDPQIDHGAHRGMSHEGMQKMQKAPNQHHHMHHDGHGQKEGGT